MHSQLSEWNSEADYGIQLSFFVYVLFFPQIKSNFPQLALCVTL